MKEFRVLLVYVNSMMDNLIPLNISYLVACLKEKGFDVRLFDTTFYRTSNKSSDEARVEMLQVKPFDLSKYGIRYKSSDVFSDFRNLVSDYKPQLIGFSVVEPTYILAEKLLDSIYDIKDKSKIIFGGVFAMLAPERILRHPMVDMVCSGEGEKTIVEAASKIRKEISLKGVDNLAVKEDGGVFYNKKSGLADLDELPFLDFSLFEKERFFKPMDGKVLKMVPVEFARGCPYMCTYCASPAIAEKSKTGRWFREKSLKRIMDEIRFYFNKYQAEYFYFISESFLSMSKDKFDKFVEEYKSIKIPFWFNSRIETISEDKLEKLESINCNRISIGLESGSEYIRRKLLKRNYSNNFFIERFKMFKGSNISVSVNNIIGFPDETREQIFETIGLNKKIMANSIGAYIFQPFHGTSLRDYCLEKGYIDNSYLAGDAHLDSGLNQANITKEEIIGLQRTFLLYTMLPEKYYNEIKIAERFDERGNSKFRELTGLYYREYSQKA